MDAYDYGPQGLEQDVYGADLLLDDPIEDSCACRIIGQAED